MRTGCICIDMDGTLLNSHKEVTLRTGVVMKMALNMGIKIVAVSGRPNGFVKSHVGRIDERIQVVGFNGAYIGVDELQKEVLIAPQIVQQILEIADFYQLRIFTKNRNQIYTNRSYTPMFCYDLMTAELEPQYQMKSLCEIASMSKFFVQNPYEVLKMILYADDVDRVSRAKMEIVKLPAKIFSSGPMHMEITDLQAGKGIALEQISKSLNIPLSDFAAIGDGDNDIEMLKICGTRIAMDNGIDQIKNMADFITADNDHEGVAKAIEFLLSRNE